jgi:arylsulfatase
VDQIRTFAAENHDVAATSMLVGEAPGAPVAPGIEPPFTFTGEIHSVTFDVSGDLIEDDEATLRRLMARQ